jgi:hypothetical protein
MEELTLRGVPRKKEGASKEFVTQTKSSVMAAKKAPPYLGYRPLEVIRRTLEQMTQLARLTMDGNLTKHRQALYPVLNRRRLQEAVATDTFFARHKDVSGANCAQVFYGITSHFMKVFGMSTESEGPTAWRTSRERKGFPPCCVVTTYGCKGGARKCSSIYENG